MSKRPGIVSGCLLDRDQRAKFLSYMFWNSISGQINSGTVVLPKIKIPSEFREEAFLIKEEI